MNTCLTFLHQTNVKPGEVKNICSLEHCHFILMTVAPTVLFLKYYLILKYWFLKYQFIKLCKYSLRISISLKGIHGKKVSQLIWSRNVTKISKTLQVTGIELEPRTSQFLNEDSTILSTSPVWSSDWVFAYKRTIMLWI